MSNTATVERTKRAAEAAQVDSFLTSWRVRQAPAKGTHWAPRGAERYLLGQAAIWAIFEFYNHVCGSRNSSCRAVASQLAGERF
jgi:hypothetical protein